VIDDDAAMLPASGKVLGGEGAVERPRDTPRFVAAIEDLCSSFRANGPD